MAAKPGDFGWSCDCEACKAARKQLHDHHPYPDGWLLPNPFWLWGMGITEQALAQKRYEEGWERTFGKKNGR